MSATVPAPTEGLTELPGAKLTRRTITAVVVLVFLMSCAMSWGNVADFCISAGAITWIGWLVGPSVDLSVIGLLLGIRFLSMHGYTQDRLHRPRCFLYGLGTLTMTLNTAGAVSHHQWWLAAVDAVGPGLLIGWSEVGPWMLQEVLVLRSNAAPILQAVPDRPRRTAAAPAHLLPRARELDAAHRALKGRHISRDTLREQLHIGRDPAGALVAVVRAEVAKSAEPVLIAA